MLRKTKMGLGGGEEGVAAMSVETTLRVVGLMSFHLPSLRHEIDEV